MIQYCVKCGKQLRDGAAFCPHCGKAVAISFSGRDDWKEMGGFLARFSLSLAKGFLFLLLGGVVFACSISGVGLLIIGATLLYNFTANGVFVLPAFLTAEFGFEVLGGMPLMLSGIVAVFNALLFAIAAASILKVFFARKGAKGAAA